MGIISVEKANHLYWLGRYTERVFTTLRKFFHVYDSMIELEKAEDVYKMYCNRLAIPDIYDSSKDFAHKYLFSEENPDSIYSNMMRAYDNAIILREELSSNVLSYIQLSLDTIKSAERSSAPLVSLQPVIDYLFAFWGCVDDYVEEEECRNLMKIGRYAERIDLYMRLDYHTKDIQKEFSKLTNRMRKTPVHYNLEMLERLIEIIEQKENWKDYYQEALNCLGEMIEVI